MYTYTLVWEDKPDMNISFPFENNKLHYDIALYHFYWSQFRGFLNITMLTFSKVSKIV